MINIRFLSGPQLSGICRRLMSNHRHTRSGKYDSSHFLVFPFRYIGADFVFKILGFPDLTMWDTINNRIAFVEVKGPNDRLSNKQILWLDYLNSLGLKGVVCHIEAINAKRVKKAPVVKTKSPKKKRLKYDSGDDFV